MRKKEQQNKCISVAWNKPFYPKEELLFQFESKLRQKRETDKATLLVRVNQIPIKFLKMFFFCFASDNFQYEKLSF